MDAFGKVTWWGFSPAVNLEQLWTDTHPVSDAEGEDDSTALNVLLVGSGDLRHVLTTLASSPRPVKFFLAESCLEVFARHLLFLKLLQEPLEHLGLQEKTELFLELYGNSLVRGQTADYLKEISTELIRIVTDLDYQKSVLPMLDLSTLKFKERDFLEGIFKFWKSADSFPIEDLWDGRLRNYLSSRYDNRLGVFDWDYYMKLQEMAPLVRCSEYKDWRESGVAFKLRDDAPYQTPNKSLSSAVLLQQQGGDTFARRGYWGDIIASPYLAFGLHTDNEELLKTHGGKYIKSSVQVSEYILSNLIKQFSCEKSSDGCSITFLPLQFKEMATKARFKKFFHVVYFSNSMVHHLSKDTETFLSEKSLLVCESVNFMLDLTKEKKEEFAKKVTGMAESLKFKVCHMEDNKHHLLFSS